MHEGLKPSWVQNDSMIGLQLQASPVYNLVHAGLISRGPMLLYADLPHELDLHVRHGTELQPRKGIYSCWNPMQAKHGPMG